MYQDILRESWVYQGILREGLEEGREQGLAEGRVEGQAEGHLQTLHQALVNYVETHFPTLVPLVRYQVDVVKDADVLEGVLFKLFSVQASSEAEQSLLTLGNDAKKI